MMKIDATDYEAIAREIGLVKEVIKEEAVIVDGVETKPAVVEEELIAEPDQRIVGIPVDAAGNPIEWTNLAARAGVMWQFDMTDVTPDPKATPDNPLPPLKVEQYKQIQIVGRDKAALQEAVAAKLTAAKAAVEATKELPAPVEGEAVIGEILP